MSLRILKHDYSLPQSMSLLHLIRPNCLSHYCKGLGYCHPFEKGVLSTPPALIVSSLAKILSLAYYYTPSLMANVQSLHNNIMYWLRTALHSFFFCSH